MKFSLKLLAIIAAITLSSSWLSAINKVVVRADATEEFIRARALDEKKKIQTYQFMKGRYFPGNGKRPTMERITFMDLLESLAVQLQRQNFYPDPENGEGDLVLVVHYGVTDYEFDYQDALGYTSLAEMGFQDVEDKEFGLQSKQWMDNSRASSRSLKSSILGMESAYDWKREFDDDDLQLMVEEPRFFVVVMAYDLPLAKQGKLQVHWMTRYSIRATGQSYDKAVQYLNDVAGNFFGKYLEELERKFPNDYSEVIVGEIEVIGNEEEQR